MQKPADPRFQTRTFDGPGGSRDYRLYVPATMPAGPNGLIVMLHGCNQDPDDFAAGPDMNRLAETHGLIGWCRRRRDEAGRGGMGHAWAVGSEAGTYTAALIQ
nr:PHB depolymerase family esterase [Acuticoccus yangtzensis]